MPASPRASARHSATNLAPRSPGAPEPLVDSAIAYARASKSLATLRAYATDWRAFATWCQAHDKQALPTTGETVALFLASEADAGRKAATIVRRSASIAAHHRLAGFESPTTSEAVRAVTSGIRRTIGTRATTKAALTPQELRSMVASIDDSTVKGARDRALLLLGFASALRRSELVALDVRDLETCAQGVVLTIRRSKTDQEGAGRIVGVPYASTPTACPVRALQHHLDASSITDGAVFRRIDKRGRAFDRLTPQSVALVVKAAATAEAQARGISPDEARKLAARYAGHSLRAGLATAAASNGASERAIMAHTGHRSPTVARRYIRSGSVWTENAAAGLL